MAPQPGLDHFTRKMGRVFCANLGLALVRVHTAEKIEIFRGLKIIEAMVELTGHIQHTFRDEHPEYYKMIEGAFEACEMDLVWVVKLLGMSCKHIAKPKGDFPQLQIFKIKVPKNMTPQDLTTGNITSIH